MSEPTSAPEPLLAPRPALAFTLGLLILLALVVAHSAWDHFHRHELEDFTSTTAVGDRQYYTLPNPLPTAPASAGVFEGQPLWPVSYRRIGLRDSRMVLAGETDGDHLRLYASHESVPPREGETERRGEPVLFLKLGPGEYLKVQPAGKARP